MVLLREGISLFTAVFMSSLFQVTASESQNLTNVKQCRTTLELVSGTFVDGIASGSVSEAVSSNAQNLSNVEQCHVSARVSRRLLSNAIAIFCLPSLYTFDAQSSANACWSL